MQYSSSQPARFPLTGAQQDIWLDQLRVGDSPLYNIGGYLDFAGTVEPERMQHAVALLVARHDALRTQLHTDANGLPGQVAVNGAVERGTVFCRIEGWIG